MRLSNDAYIKKLLVEHKYEILNGKDITGEFPDDNSNWHYALGHFDLRHGYIDKNGNLHFKIYDTYDFNEENKTAINQAGRQQMIKGNLKPYFSIHDVMIPKSKLKEIWK